MKYPNRIQAAVLLETRFEGLDAIARDFERIVEMKSGATFARSEHAPGVYLRLFGGGEDLSVTFEYADKPPSSPIFDQAFDQALASPVTAIRCPDMADRVKLARSHILLEVWHGPLGAIESEPVLAALMEQLGTSLIQPSAEAFNRRLETLATMVRVVIDAIMPSAIHWTQSNQLLTPQAFEDAASEGFPGPLAIQPMLFTQEQAEAEVSGPLPTGLRTFGARHWLGREIRVPATDLPWTAAIQSAVTFCATVAQPEAEIPADGDMFGPDDESEIWRVHHREAEADGGVEGDNEAIPLIELVPLRHDACRFVSEEYARQASVTMVRKSREAASPAEPANGSLTKTAPEALPEPQSKPEDETLSDATREEASLLSVLEAALAEGIAEAAANPPKPLRIPVPTGTPSQPGGPTVSGRGLRAQLFGNRAD